MKIAVGGSAADPPHKGHLQVLRKICGCGAFDLVIWIVSGDRKDKKISVCPNHRIAMTELMIPRKMRTGKSPSIVVIYDDIYRKNTPTIEWLEKILPEQYRGSEICWFTGSDSVIPLKKYGGKCAIQASWKKGKKLFKKYPFIVIERASYPLSDVTLPENFLVLPGVVKDIASSQIRQLIADGGKYDHLLPKAVADYIDKHGLYIKETKHAR